MVYVVYQWPKSMTINWICRAAWLWQQSRIYLPLLTHYANSEFNNNKELNKWPFCPYYNSRQSLLRINDICSWAVICHSKTYSNFPLIKEFFKLGKLTRYRGTFCLQFLTHMNIEETWLKIIRLYFFGISNWN